MFCTECGTRNTADSKYCKECGAKVNDGYRTMMLSVDDMAAVDDTHDQERLKKLLDMAFWHNQSGNLDAAVLAGEAALAIHPNCTTAHSLLGTLYEKKGDDARAIEHFEDVVRLNPGSAADVAKLDQVRRGVRIKAVEPPRVYQWLPPVLVGFNWEKSKDALMALRPKSSSASQLSGRLPKLTPLMASCVVGALVLAVGLMFLRPTLTAKATGAQTTTRTPSVTAAPVAASAYGGASANPAGQNNGLPAPVVLRGGNGVAVSPPPLTAVNPDPFGETLPPNARTAPLFETPRDARPERVAALPRKGRGLAPALPALSLRAVPLSGGSDSGLAPAPVSLPGMASVASAGAVPQHTVVVSNLGGPPTPQTASLNTYANPSGPTNPLASHIKITINSSPASENVAISDHDVTARSSAQSANTDGQSGDAFQQSAISLQQQGDFRHARAAYQKAIRAYKAQIASGQDSDVAAQGLAASQTGLQICEQSRQ